MLHNQGIRTKLLAVLALPILALVIVAGVISLQAFGQAGRARQVESLAQDAGALGTLVSSLQAERTVSVAALQMKPVAAELKKARASTDAALAASQELLGSVDLAALSPQATAAATQAARGHADLKTLRAEVTQGFVEAPQVADRYATIIGYDIALPQRIGGGLADRAIGAQLSSYSTAQQLVELATQERETGLTIISAGAVDGATGSALARTTALQNEAVVAFRQDATPDQVKALDAALFMPVAARATYRDTQQDMLAVGTGGRVTLSSSTWRNATNDRITALRTLAGPIAGNAAAVAGASASSASTRASLVLAGGGLLVALLVLLGLVLSRTITRPLRRLTEVAAQMRDELPLMVERMATPGDGPGVTTPDIPVGGNDEVGRLAQAFRDVNATTVRVAEEQAALRASIAEMFVNVARRNHVLLSRQLSFIDQLERTEENPDTLDNLFRLDHLATRMRRNAESLIVLAGIDAGRRLRRPMPLSDVIRTGVSEIERYDRVDLALQADPPMVGHVALTAAHLLAELLENATQFSNPDTRVVTATTFTSRGVRITITDHGLGMTWDEISDANERIANPPMSDVVGSQRLGFYVVGRLARRLDATIELKPGRAQGTIVTIDLPPGLFVAGTVIEIPIGLDDAFEAGPDQPQLVDLTDGGTLAGPADTGPTSPDAPRGGGLAQRGSAPAQPVPAPPVAERDDLLSRPSPVVVPGSLPTRRGSRESVDALAGSPAADTLTPLAPEAPPAEAPRGGIFSGFRARREPAMPVPTGADALGHLPALADSATTFVPVLEPAADVTDPTQVVRDLPHRATLPAVVPTDDPVNTIPGLSPSALDAVLLAPGPLDAGWVPTFVTEPVAPVAPVVEAVAPVEAEWAPVVLDAEPAPALEPHPVPVVEQPAPAGGARSALSELAAEQEPEPERTAPASAPLGVMSMDILPARSASRGLRLRRPGKAKPAPVPPPPSARVTAQTRLSSTSTSTSTSSSTPAPAPVSSSSTPAPEAPPWASSTPVADAGTFAGSPFTQMAAESTSAGAVPPPPPAGPIAAPTSLFATAPSTDVGPAPAQSLFEQPVSDHPVFSPPVVDQPVLDHPVFSQPVFSAPAAHPPVEHEPVVPTPAVPALGAGQSLRERSAMASEALSELSALSTYRPEALPTAPANLVRRTPLASGAGQPPVPAAEPDGPRRGNRNAADVRSMLSGFQAGVERGRTSPGVPRATSGTGQ